MNNFFIIANKQKDINLEITEQIRHHISRLGAVCNIYDQYDRDVSSIDIPEETQCILVIGGDGTILAAARMLVGSNIPLLGINLGTLGFLADVNLADLSKTLDLLLQDQYQVENRIMLTAEVYKQGKKAATYIALNDFNINRFGASRVIGLKVGINGSVIDRYRADGVIVCTPTGSTGYNSILFEEPVSIEAYKPFLYRTVRLIIRSHREEALSFFRLQDLSSGY